MVKIEGEQFEEIRPGIERGISRFISDWSWERMKWVEKNGLWVVSITEPEEAGTLLVKGTIIDCQRESERAWAFITPEVMRIRPGETRLKLLADDLKKALESRVEIGAMSKRTLTPEFVFKGVGHMATAIHHGLSAPWRFLETYQPPS